MDKTTCKFITTTIALSTLCLAGAARAETAKPYPTYICKTTVAPIRYDAVMLIDHADNPKLRGVVTLEDLTSLPADFTAPAVQNAPWHSYDALVVEDTTATPWPAATLWVDGSGRTVGLALSHHKGMGWLLVKNREGGEMTISTCMTPN